MVAGQVQLDQIGVVSQRLYVLAAHRDLIVVQN